MFLTCEKSSKQIIIDVLVCKCDKIISTMACHNIHWFANSLITNSKMEEVLLTLLEGFIVTFFSHYFVL